MNNLPLGLLAGMDVKSLGIDTTKVNKFKIALIFITLVIIFGLLTLGSGMFVKLFMKANNCHQTKLLLFLSGMILYFLVIGLSVLAGKYMLNINNALSFGKWVTSEQYRYEESDKPVHLGGSNSGGSTL